MLNILWMIIPIIILIIIFLLYSGIRIRLNYTKKNSELEGCLKVLILKKIPVYTITYPLQENREKQSKEFDFKKILELAKPCFNDLKKYVQIFIKNTHIEKLENHLIFGLDDYADTGKYIGIIWAVMSVINSSHEKIMLSAQPSFSGSTLDGYGENDININIIKLIIPTYNLICKKEVHELIKGVIHG